MSTSRVRAVPQVARRVVQVVVLVVLAGAFVAPPAALAGTLPSAARAPATAWSGPSAASASDAASLPARVVLTTTSGGRRVIAQRQGSAEATRVLLVLGQMHGNERDAPQVVRELRRRAVPDGVALWTITTLNPDGRAAGSRTNGRGVDLNRNFPHHWFASAPGSSRWSGPSPASEAETTALMSFLELIRPDAVLSYHQPFAMVDITGDKTRDWALRLARWTGLAPGTATCVTRCGGTMAGWFNARFPGWAITVELPGGRVSQDMVDRNADAVLRIATLVVDYP